MNTGFKILLGTIGVGVIALLLTFFLKNYQIVQRDVIRQDSTRVVYVPKTDTVTVVQYRTKPVPYPVVKDSFIEVPARVDTALILQDYLLTWIYDDTLKNDAQAFVTLSDTVTRNRIQGRQFRYMNRIKCPEPVPIPEKRAEWFVGVDMGYSDGVRLAPCVRFVSKTNYIISASYDIPGGGAWAGIAFRLGR